MPALFALAMHQALVALQPELRPEERSLSFLNDLHLTAQPDRIQPLFQAAPRCLYERALITQKHVCGTQPQSSRQAWRTSVQRMCGVAMLSSPRQSKGLPC